VGKIERILQEVVRMIIHISIIDDDQSFAALIKDKISCIRFDSDIYLYAKCFSSAEALSSKDILDTDLALIDIELPGIGGIQLAQRIREASERVIMAFITNHSHYSIEAYGYNVADYILKAMTDEQVPVMMQEIKEIIELTSTVVRQRGDAIVSLITDTGYTSVRGSEIKYVETVKKSHRSTAYSDAGDINLNMTLEQFMSAADGGHFIRIHRSYVVNLDRIRKVRVNSVTMDDGAVLPLSRSKRHDLVEEMGLTSNKV
jgi:DNA-binding LytR/AlgR family response regulator